MPKMKSHSATRKRIRKTGGGKVKTTHANRLHLKGNKSKKATRRNRRTNYVQGTDAKRVKQLISPAKK